MALPIAAAMTEASPAERLEAVKSAIAGAARLARRSPDDVTLIAVSKTHGAEAIEPILHAGHRLFGENRVQEAQATWPELRQRFEEVELHLVGRLQSNKAKEAVALFDAINSVDRPSLVAALGQAIATAGKRHACFVHVNLGDASQKGGRPVAQLRALRDFCAAPDHPLVG